MKFFETRTDRGWPRYLPGGRIRTTTAALLVAFVALSWVHETYSPAPQAPEAPSTQVVPPGFVPDPNYTWVPRTNVRRPKEAATTTTPTTTTTAPTTTTPTTTSPTEPVNPFAPDTTSPTSPTTATPPVPEEASPTPTTAEPTTTPPPPVP